MNAEQRQTQRSVASIVIVLLCACTKREDNQQAQAEASTPPPAAQPSTIPSALQPVPDPHATVQSETGADKPHASQPAPAIERSPCIQKSRILSDDSRTPWGDTPREILKNALGTHRATLTWQRESAFSYDAEGTSTTLIVKITRKGPAKLYDEPEIIRRNPETGMRWDFDCVVGLQIPVHVNVKTQDGAIAVEGDSTLAVSSRQYIGVSIGQQFATHRGTLQIREIREKGLSVPGFGINLGFTRKRVMVGEVRGSYEIEGVGALYVEYACFPNEPPPELLGTGEVAIGCR